MKKVNLKRLKFTKNVIAKPIGRMSQAQIIAGYANSNQNANQNAAPPVKAVTYEYSPCQYYSQIQVDGGCPTSDNGPCPN